MKRGSHPATDFPHDAEVILLDARFGVLTEGPAALDDPANGLFLSHASVWELHLKWQAGKLKLPQPPGPWLTSQLAVRGVSDWAVDLESLRALLDLPAHHRDPFDRMLVAQAKVHAFTLITPDPWIKKYKPSLPW